MRALLVGGLDAALAGEVLARRGHEVVVAEGASAAADALARGPTPDLVVVAAGDGAAAARAVGAVRGHVRGETAPLVALVPAEAVEAALDAGASFALASPVPPAQLVATLAAAERHARPPRQEAPVDPGHELYFKSNPNPMWFFDLDTLAFVAVNDAAVRKYGWSREELLRMTIKDIRPPEDLERLLRATGRVAAGLDHTTGWRHRARDGRIFHVEIISYPVRYAGRACELVLAHDVSDRVEAERQLEELRAQVALTERIASIGTLAAGVAHEINNPLTSVLANLAFVEERLARLSGQECAAVAEAIGEAADAARRVHAIAADLRGFARADEGPVGPVDVARAAQAAVALAANALRHRARVVVEADGAPRAVATEARLAQVLLNLVVNAAQAIPEGDAAGNLVRVSARADGDRVAIEVTDTGPGVPAEIRARIFDPFFTTKAVGDGTGLGLWVCRRVVSQLGGTIELLSRTGRGAAFRVTLPAASAAAAPQAGPQPPTAPPGPAPARRPRVLVVDDEPLVRRAILRALREDAEVALEESPRAALARLERGERFELVLCDVMMPELPGADLHAALERLDPALARSVVFMTGGAFSAREQQFLARIPNVCLEKPLDLARLRALVRAAR
ncbi:MAG TPA: ATP-binding protein [Anaeromyxobacter sp.]